MLIGIIANLQCQYNTCVMCDNIPLLHIDNLTRNFAVLKVLTDTTTFFRNIL